MKTTAMIFFVTIVLLIHTAVNYYIFQHGWQALEGFTHARVVYAILFIALFLSYVAARFLEHTAWFGLTKLLTIVGSWWLGAMLYFFLFVLLVDIVRLSDHWFHWMPMAFSENSGAVKLMTGGVGLLAVLVLLAFGHYTARHPVVRHLNLTIHKRVEGMETIRVVAVSDIHMGLMTGRKQMEKMVGQINELSPDLVIFVGDVIDELLTFVVRDQVGEPLKRIRSAYGMYAITGNHEYIGHIDESVAYIESLGIRMIRDTALVVDGKVTLAGREDRDINRFTSGQRKELSEIINRVDHSLPLIVLDHQPFHLEKSEQSGVDLQISGHTHHGQLWPFNYITKAIYEVSWGYLKKGNTHIYVSSGYGTWGPPMRLGSKPELMLFDLSFALP